MYKKITLFFALLNALVQSAPDVTPWIEIKPSYFFFSESPVKDIYDCGRFQIQSSASMPIYKYLNFYTSAGYRKADGHSLNSREKTSLSSIVVDVGIKPIINFGNNCYWFCAAGPRYFSLHQHNQSLHVDGIVHGAGIGFFGNAGLNILFADHMLLGIFGEYSYERKEICPRMSNVYSNGSVQTGGFALGVSLGYAF